MSATSADKQLPRPQEVFISYSRKDKDFVRRLDEPLKSRVAMQVDPANARLTAHLGRRLADQALEQGTDPDEDRRARGEADFLTSRAQNLAPDSEDVKSVRDEVVKLLELKTN